MEIEERTLSYEQFMKGVTKGGILVDIREEEHTRFGTIPGAVTIPALQPQKLYQLPEDKKIFLLDYILLFFHKSKNFCSTIIFVDVNSTCLDHILGKLYQL